MCIKYAFGAQCAAMDRLEEARLTWERAQADLQHALAELEKCVADTGSEAQAVNNARLVVAMRQEKADEQLQRYITYLGKSD